MSGRGYSELMLEIVALSTATGAKSIKDLPGCWEYRWPDADGVPDGWGLSINGHEEDTKDSGGWEVPPFTAMVKRRGMPVAIIAPFGGEVIGVSEDVLIDVVTAERKRLEVRA